MVRYQEVGARAVPGSAGRTAGTGLWRSAISLTSMNLFLPREGVHSLLTVIHPTFHSLILQ